MGMGVAGAAKGLGPMVSGLKAVKLGQIAAKTATAVATGVQWLFNAAMTANPIGLVVLGIAALIAIIVLLVTHWSTVTAFLTKTWQGFVNWIRPSLNAFGRFFSAIWTGAKKVFQAVWTWIVNYGKGQALALKSFVMNPINVLKALWRAGWYVIRDVLPGVWTSIKTRAGGAVDWVRTKVQGGVDTLKGGWSRAWGGIKSAVSAPITGIKTKADGLVTFFTGMPGKITRATSGMWNGISGGFKGAINTVISSWNGLSFGLPAIKVLGKQITPAFRVNTPDIPYLAKGTNYFGGGTAIVGEDGPELVSMPVGAKVLPAGRTAAATSQSGPQHIDNRKYFEINEAEDPMGSANRVDKVLRKWEKK